jgi:hypothetical protein
VTPREYDVHVSFKYIRYGEGDQSLVIDREPSGTAAEGAIVWVPSRDRWAASVEPWARDRRDEILERIRTHAPAGDLWKEW